MNLGWLPSLGIYILGLGMIGLTFKKYLRKSAPTSKQKLETLLVAEQNAQFTRTKALSSDQFIKVDFSKYPTVNDMECQKKYNALMNYSKVQMVNLQGKSNLELKQLYGPQMLEKIGAYEQNFFEFMELSIQYGKTLYEQGYINEARQTLEQCISYHCDVSKCYVLLIEIYKEQNDKLALEALKASIEQEMRHSPFLHKVLNML